MQVEALLMLSIIQRHNKASDIKLVSLHSTIKMMHGPVLCFSTNRSVCQDTF